MDTHEMAIKYSKFKKESSYSKIDRIMRLVQSTIWLEGAALPEEDLKTLRIHIESIILQIAEVAGKGVS